MNILSIILIIFSLLMLSIKGLNFGVDFKGGTLIEIRSENPNIDITNIRQSLIKMNLGDVNVKKFNKENDYLVKIEISKTNDSEFIKKINSEMSSDLGSVINFRRVENVGPKVSGELLKAGLLAITLSLAAMLFYIWIRFEWQFSVAAIAAIIHDVIITVGIFSLFYGLLLLYIICVVQRMFPYVCSDLFHMMSIL